MLLLVLLMLLVIVWMWLRQRQAQQPATKHTPDRRITSSKTEYHAVSIKFPADACLAAKELHGRRFLAAEAPQLPLPACNAAQCHCVFTHHPDRRSGKDRRSPFAARGMAGSTGRYQAERRQGQDRRKRSDEPDPR